MGDKDVLAGQKITPSVQPITSLPVDSASVSLDYSKVLKAIDGFDQAIKNIDVRSKELDNKIKNLEDKSQELDDKQKRSSEEQARAINFMLWLTSAVVIVFFIAVITIGLDYVNNNYTRHEKFSEELLETRNNSYSKEEIDRQMETSKKNGEILACMKYKKYWQYEQCLK